MPKDWLKSNFTTLPKKRDARDAKNHQSLESRDQNISMNHT